jgi:predicted nucleic acid-binding protein
MKLLITDTNVFIDIIRLDKINEFLELSQEIHTTQFVINELKPNQKEALSIFENNKLIIKSFEADEVLEIFKMKVTRNNVSKRIADRSVLYYATNREGILISGDKNLKKEAQEKGLEVHGTIWIISEMFRQNILGLTNTISTLEELKEINPFLPIEEINLIIKEIKVL